MMNADWDIIIQWDLPFEEYLAILQNKTTELSQNKEKKYLLFCSHPHCFTNGRGLRNLKDGPALVNLTPEAEKHLPLPLFPINRGGGLTFHYPGQLIVYPIVNLNVFPKALMTLMHILLITTGETLKEMNLISEYSTPKEVYGLWTQQKKIASIGMGLDHYITQHGLALNFFHDEKMFRILESIFPCGISANTYSSIESLFNGPLSQTDRVLCANTLLHNFLKKITR